jgi:hypothetical protein
MDPLLILPLTPSQSRQLPALNYSGLLILRWQILLPATGTDPSSLKAAIKAKQPIDNIGHLERGQWSIPGGDRLYAPLAEVPYNPAWEWLITTPSGFKGSQLSLFPYTPPILTIPSMAIINAAPAGGIDLSPVVAAIQTADQNATAMGANLSGRLDQLISDNQPAMGNKWIEFKTNPWTGNSIDGKALDPDANRRSVTFSIPAVDSNSNSPNTAQVYINIGDVNRTQEDDYDYTVTPGASIVITGDEAAQQICCYQATGTQATLCNLTWIFK